MTDQLYQPSSKVLEKYAQVLVNFALNSGEGIKPNEVVEITVPDVAKPLALALQNEVLKAGAHPIMRLLPTGFDKDYYGLANKDQLTFFPKKFWSSKAELLDHQIQIIADPEPQELRDIKPAKIISARDSKKPYRDWLIAKENKGKFTWTIALWAVSAKAKIVGLSLKEYWQQIIQACYLDEKDPIKHWQKVARLQEEIKAKLNSLPIKQLHIEGADADLVIELGKDRVWHGGSGRNIPSFEIFTSPDWHNTNGWYKCNQPIYRYGNVINDIEFKFKDGLVIEAKAKTGNDLLQAMLKSDNANKIGEFSLTDKRMSRITHPMAEILFDENIGGKYGNTHIALGSAYKECYKHLSENVTREQWEELGFNDSAEHTDFINTNDRVVTATMADGSTKIIYKDGQFVL